MRTTLVSMAAALALSMGVLQAGPAGAQIPKPAIYGDGGPVPGNPIIVCNLQRLAGKTCVGYELVVMDENGLNPHTIATSPSPYYFPSPSWSPDLDNNPGNGYQGKIAFGLYGDFDHIYTVSVSTDGATLSWEAPQYLALGVPSSVDGEIAARFRVNWFATWSPVLDGTHGTLAVRGYATCTSTGTVEPGVYLVPDDHTGTPQYVGPGYCPAWDPEGQWIAAGHSTGLIRYDALSAAPALLVEHAFASADDSPRSDPSWGPNGIAFIGTTASGRKVTSALCVLQPDLTTLSKVPATSDVRHPCWRYTAGGIVASTASGLILIDPETGSRQTLVPYTKAFNLSSPDCRR